MPENPTRAAWLNARRLGIGGSDIAAIVGMNPYAGPMDVWLDKTGQKPEKEITPAMEWGTRLESQVAQKFQDNHPDMTLSRVPYLIAVGQEPWALCSPDGLIGEAGYFEAKAPGGRQVSRWGEEGTDDVPPQYLLQCQWGMGVTGRNYAWLAALIGGQDYREYPIAFDRELYQFLYDAAKSFWFDHVIACVPPPLDGSQASADYLEAKFPGCNGELPVITAPSGLAILDEFAALQRVIVQAETRKDELRNHIVELIGENDGVLWPGGQITYRRPKDSQATEWKTLCEDLRGVTEPSVFDQLFKLRTKTKVNSRRFVPKLKESTDGKIEFASLKELP